jgi:hypothetical protein
LSAAEFRNILVSLDIDGAVSFWSQLFPGHPVPASRKEVLVAMHMARTSASSINFQERAYSHHWLQDHNFPSLLPDPLKPRAERLYPKLVGGVGISVNSKYPVVRNAIQGAMTNAVLEAYADGHEDDPETVKKRMLEARQRERKGLGL